MRRGTAITDCCHSLGMRRRAWYAMLWGITLAVWSLATTTSHADEIKRVLIIHSIQSDLPVTQLIDNSIRQEMRAQLPGRIEIFSEFLDSLRSSEPQRDERMASFLREKYAKHPFDLLISIGPEALNLLVQRRASLFADAPIIFAGIREDNELLRSLPTGVTGLTSYINPVPTIELALHLQPWARNLVVVTGAAEFDRLWEKRARQMLAGYENRLKTTYFSGLPMAELLRKLGQLRSDTIVLYLSILREGAGQTFIPKDAAREAIEATTAPVYAVYDTYLGMGMVGGYMVTFESVGIEAGRLGLRVLAGARPQTIPPSPVTTEAAYVDWRQLKRWRLDSSQLPPNSVVLFREPSLWKRYKLLIGTGCALLVAQSLLIAALFAQGRRRLRAERAALESEERISLATTSAHLGLWHWDISSNRLWVSDICRQIMGLGSQANVGLETFLGLVHREDQSANLQSLEPSGNNRGLERAEHHLVLPDGSDHWVRAVKRMDFDASGRPARMTGVIIDVTQEKLAERESAHWRQELMHATRVATLGELSGAMAHELNQPLTAILSNADAAHLFLTRKDCNLTEVRDILADIVTQTRRAGEIIRHLRALFTKSETQISPLNINEVVADVLRLVRSDLVARRVSVTSRLASDLPAVEGDRVQLQQVLLNLIANACDAMAENEPAERNLTVMTAQDGHLVTQISVADRGSGIKPEMLDGLFKPFVSTKSRGLGVGLSICRSIVEAHGGRLWAINNPERGATFCVALPADGGARS
jgi:PAS domain S-box-containing protein